MPSGKAEGDDQADTNELPQIDGCAHQFPEAVECRIAAPEYCCNAVSHIQSDESPSNPEHRGSSLVDQEDYGLYWRGSDGSIEGERKGNVLKMSVIGKFKTDQRVCHQFRNDTSAPKRYGKLKTVDGIRGSVQWDDNGKIDGVTLYDLSSAGDSEE